MDSLTLWLIFIALALLCIGVVWLQISVIGLEEMDRSLFKDFLGLNKRLCELERKKALEESKS